MTSSRQRNATIFEESVTLSLALHREGAAAMARTDSRSTLEESRMMSLTISNSTRFCVSLTGDRADSSECPMRVLEASISSITHGSSQQDRGRSTCTLRLGMAAEI